MHTSGNKRRIVITGAAGRIGLRLRTHLGRSPDYELVLIDLDNRGDADIHCFNLSRYQPDWARLFAGADAVVHLAGDPRPTAPWRSVSENNIEATFNLFRAAAEHGVPRVLYASSLLTMEGYRYGRGVIAADAPPRPVSFYASSKLMGEAIGRQFSRDRGLSVICLRIGDVEVDRTSPGRDVNSWRQSRWLSVDDLCQAIEKAILVSDPGYVVLPLTSDNSGMRWDLAETCRVLGYEPTKPAPPLRPYMYVRLRALLGYALKRLFDPSWRDYW